MKLSSEMIHNAILKTHIQISSGHQSVNNGKTYLAYFCLKTSDIEQITEKANNCFNLKVAKDPSEKKQLSPIHN